jgi:hypothetical protein
MADQSWLDNILRGDPKTNPTPIEYGTIPQGQEDQFENIGTLNEPMFQARSRGIGGPPPINTGIQQGPIPVNPFGEDGPGLSSAAPGEGMPLGGGVAPTDPLEAFGGAGPDIPVDPLEAFGGAGPRIGSPPSTLASVQPNVPQTKEQIAAGDIAGLGVDGVIGRGEVPLDPNAQREARLAAAGILSPLAMGLGAVAAPAAMASGPAQAGTIAGMGTAGGMGLLEAIKMLMQRYNAPGGGVGVGG